MNSHHTPTNITSDPTTSAQLSHEKIPFRSHVPVTGWHALEGLPIGILRGLSPGTDLEVCVENVIEEAPDLAVADRVAWVLAGRTGRQHAVLASSTGYVVATVSPELDWAAAMRLEPGEWAPRIVSIASADGVLPVLMPIAG